MAIGLVWFPSDDDDNDSVEEYGKDIDCDDDNINTQDCDVKRDEKDRFMKI